MGKTPAGLQEVQLAAQTVDQIDALVYALLRYHASMVSAHHPILDRMKLLARDCYLQGLRDAQSVATPPDISRLPLGDPKSL